MCTLVEETVHGAQVAVNDLKVRKERKPCKLKFARLALWRGDLKQISFAF